MRQLDVFLGDKLVGHVVENRKGGRFEYEQSVADKLAGRPVLSMAFPAKGRPFGEAKTSAWFNGLLPEGSRRDERRVDGGKSYPASRACSRGREGLCR